MLSPTASLSLKIAHVFLNRKNSLRSNSLRFYTENFPDFLNAAEKNVGSTIKLFSCRKETTGVKHCIVKEHKWRGVKKKRT
jgi:hypothetical protein